MAMASMAVIRSQDPAFKKAGIKGAVYLLIFSYPLISVKVAAAFSCHKVCCMFSPFVSYLFFVCFSLFRLTWG